MLGRVLAVLFSLSFFLSFPVSASCNLVPRISDNFRQTAWDVAVDTNLVWVATGYGVQLHDADGNVLGSLALPGETRAIAVRNGVVYAGSESTVFVLQRTGRSIDIVASVAAGGSINDMVATTHLFVATDAGIRHYHLNDPLAPAQSNVSFFTTSPAVTSLAIEKGLLHAADGDASIEVFSLANPSLPQRTPPIEASTAISSVHFANNLLFASDRLGRVTELFAGPTRVATLPYGSNAFASQGHLLLMAGPDRTLRAVDVTLLNRVAKRREWQLVPTDGSHNAIRAVAAAPGRFYVASGDAGLGIIDGDALTSPFVLAAYADGATSGVAASEGGAVFSRGAEIAQQRLVAGGISLVEERTSPAPAGSVIRDLRDTRLLSTAGSSATLWSLGASATVRIFEATFPATIVAAVIRDTDVAALLSDGTLWTSSGAAPQKAPTAPAHFLSRGEAGIITAELRENGTTVVRYYSGANLAAETRSVTLAGAAVGRIAVEGTQAAAFTFNGVNLIDLTTGSVTTFADSNGLIPRDLAIDDGNVMLVDRRNLVVFGPSGAKLQEHALPADAIALDARNGIAYIATTEGATAVIYGSPSPALELPFRNSFYSAIAAAGEHLYLMDENGVDVFETGGRAPRFKTAVRTGGIVAVAATTSGLVTVSANLRVASVSPEGVQLRERLLDEGADATVIAAHAVGEAVWISISSGCTSGSCSGRTLVLDAATLTTTATMTGSITDLATTASRTFVLTDLPDEMRVLDTSDPTHPSIIASAQLPAGATSIAGDASTVYVLGDVLRTFSISTLSAGPELPVPGEASPAQRIRISGGCAIVTGRSELAELYSLPSFSHASMVPLPSTARDAVFDGTSFFVLTDHSLEWWSSTSPVTPARRRAF